MKILATIGMLANMVAPEETSILDPSRNVLVMGDPSSNFRTGSWLIDGNFSTAALTSSITSPVLKIDLLDEFNIKSAYFVNNAESAEIRRVNGKLTIKGSKEIDSAYTVCA